MSKSNFIVRGGADFSGITNAMNKTQAQLKGFQGGIGKSLKLVSAALGAIAIGGFIKDSTQMAMSVESATDNISRNMGNSATAFNEWVKTQSKGLGMAKADAYKYGSTFSNLLGSFSSGTEETANETQKLMKAAAIISSKTGRTYEDTAERIRSGMLGSTEAIEDLGVYTQVSMLESTDAFKKFANGKSWAQLNFKVQQQIRLAAILEQTYKRYGDTLADTTQTRQAIFIASLKNIQLNIGQAFLPIYNAVLPALTALANKIEAVTSTFSQFTQALFGKAKTASTTEEQANAMTGLGDATEEAGKKAKNALAGFDEINNLSDGKDSDSTTSTPGTNTQVGENTTISPEIQKMADNLKKLFEPVTVAFENLKTSAEPLINTIGSALSTFYNNVLIPFGTWTINEAIPSFLNLIGAALTVLNPILQSFEPIGSWLWTNFLQPLAAWTGSVFIASMDGVTGALKNVGAWMTDNKPIVEGITTSVVAFVGAWKLTELLAFVQMSGGIVGAFNAIKNAIISCTAAKIADKFETIALTALYAKDLVVSIAKSTSALVSQVWQWGLSTGAMVANKVAMVASTIAQGAMTLAMGTWNAVCGIGTTLTTAFGVAMTILTSPITLVILAIAALVAGIYLLITHWDDVKKAASVAWSRIVDVWNIASEWFNSNVIQPITMFFAGLWTDIKTNASNAWDMVEEIFAGAGKWFTDKVTTPIGDAFITAWNGIKSGFSTAFGFIETGIKIYINSYIGVVECFVNAFIKGINFIIDSINKIQLDVPDWVEKITGMKTFGFNLGRVSEVSIPRLAKGGITNGEMIATIGDNPGGREVVSPLSDLTNIIASAVGTAVLNAMQMSGGNQNNRTGEIIMEMDSNKLARAIIPSLDREIQRMGYKTVLQKV